MTFKHSKFEDSVVMRNLVRIAKEKGMIKDPIQKVASKLDLTPTEDLFENVLKLASGLRANGFEVQANELESNLMLYKMAKVEGDIIEEAHPKGGLEFKDVLGHPKFHTLIEQQMKMVDVAFKEPNGKLAKADEIISEVKKRLFGFTESENSVENDKLRLNKLLNEIKVGVQKISPIFIKASTESEELIIKKLSYIINSIKDESVMDSNSISMIKANLESLYSFAPGIFSSTEKKDLYDSISSVLNDLVAKSTDCIWLKRSIVKKESLKNQFPEIYDQKYKTNVDAAISTEKVNSDEGKKLVADFDAAIKDVGLFKDIVKSKNLANGKELDTWLSQAAGLLVKNKEEYSALENKANIDIINNYSKKIQDIKLKLQAFKQKWLV